MMNCCLNMGRCEDCKCFIIRCFRGERCKSCSRALQAKEMAELNAPFVLPGEEIRVPLKATRPTDTRAASDIFEAWGLSEDHIQIFGQPQSACIVEASAADSSGTNYFEANFDVFRTLPPAEDDLLAMQDKECSLAPRNDACTCTNLDGDMLSRNTLRTCEWSLQGYKALSWENLAPQGKYVSKIRKQAPLIRVADIVLLGVKIERPDAMETLHVLSLVHLLLLCERCASDGVLTSAAADGSSLDATAAWDTSPTPSASQPPGVTQSSSDLALICPTSLPAPLQVSEADQVRRAKCRTICLSNYFSTGSKNSFIQSNYPGSPLWLIVPDSYLCSISTGQNRNLYNQVWECSNICSNFGSSRTCSSTCGRG
eukprot:Em0004g1214a